MGIKARRRVGECRCDGCGSCVGCVRVLNPCPGPGLVPISGSLVQIYEAGTSNLLGSGTSDSDGVVCDLPAGVDLVDVRLSKSGYQTILYVNQVIACEGTLDLQQRAGGYVRCWGMSCNVSAGRVPTTWTFTRTGFATISGTTGSSGFVDLWLPATGTWSRTISAPGFITQGPLNFNYNNSCGAFELSPAGFSSAGTPVAGKFCGCSGFAGSPRPFSTTATVTDCGGSTSVDIEGNGSWCGINFLCVDRDLGDASNLPTMPNSYCFNNTSTFRRQLCGSMPWDDKGNKSVKIGISIFANQSATPTGGQTSPQVSKTWDENCVEDEPAGSGSLSNCSPPNLKSETWRDARFTCEDITAGGVSWSQTGYAIHSYDPPVVEILFAQTPDFARVSGGTPPPGGPPCPSIILSVAP